MAGTPLKNLRVFEKLCGKDFKKIVFTTTMWDDIDEPTGTSREQELQEVYWRPLINKGSSVKRFHRTRTSFIHVLQPIIDSIYKKKALLLQQELEDHGLTLNQTTAGKTLFQHLQHLVALQQERLDRIRQELKEYPLDKDSLQELMEEYREVATQMRRAEEDAKALKISKRSRISDFISKLTVEIRRGTSGAIRGADPSRRLEGGGPTGPSFQPLIEQSDSGPEPGVKRTEKGGE
jgi:hypothetical protein